MWMSSSIPAIGIKVFKYGGVAGGNGDASEVALLFGLPLAAADYRSLAACFMFPFRVSPAGSHFVHARTTDPNLPIIAQESR